MTKCQRINDLKCLIYVMFTNSNIFVFRNKKDTEFFPDYLLYLPN